MTHETIHLISAICSIGAFAGLIIAAMAIRNNTKAIAVNTSAINAILKARH